MSPRSDVLILGAGVIGLSLALELRTRGLHVRVLDPARPLAQASTAAAGMLAAEDPFNPAALRALAERSIALYPKFLTDIQERSGLAVPFQTNTTQQHLADGSVLRLAEHSLDPRQLAPALLAAAQHGDVRIEPDSASTAALAPEPIVVIASGAWKLQGVPVTPRKGQMLRVQLPGDLPLHEVLRNAHTYIVPRLHGPQAGTAILGATLEDAGFDLAVHSPALAQLRHSVAALLPEIEDADRFPIVESWAGLRPATPDELPILGELTTSPNGLRPRKTFAATGHFRNGILLAPATADVMADLIEGKRPRVDLAPFSPHRFQTGPLR